MVKLLVLENKVWMEGVDPPRIGWSDSALGSGQEPEPAVIAAGAHRLPPAARRVGHDEKPTHAHDWHLPAAGADHGEVGWVHGDESG